MFPKNKKIGIDLDETITCTFGAVLEHTKSLHPRLSHIEFDNLTHHDWWKIDALWLSKEETIECFRRFGDINPLDTKISPVSFSQEGLQLLKTCGYSLYAVTGRDELSRRESTEAWINRHFPNTFESITFTNYLHKGRVEKSEVCKRLWISLMIEDNLDFALELAGKWVKTYVLSQPWNRDRIERHENIKRVADWQEIIYDIQKMHG